jgi:hypothetical protein
MSRGRTTAAAAGARWDDNEKCDLTSEEEKALLQSIAEDERDEVIPWEKLLDQLRRR